MIDFDGYIQWMLGQQRSKRTIRNYCYELKRLPNDFREQQSFALQNKNKRMLISAWRSFLKFLKREKIITGDELFELLNTHKLPKKRGRSHSKRRGQAFPFEEWREIVRNAPNRIAKMGIWIGFHFGLRLSEILYLRIQDIDLDKELIYITGENREDEWTPKYERERAVPINRKQVKIFQKWLNVRSEELKHSYLLWIERTGSQVSDRTFQRWCKKAHPELSPHDLRYSYATNLYYASAQDVKAVSLVLGHSNVAITSDYLRLDEKEFLGKVRKALA